MRRSRSLSLALFALVLLSACERAGGPGGPAVPTPPDPPDPRPATAPPTASVVPASGARSAAALDSTTSAERAEAVAERAATRRLGRTVVSLGAPAETGFWMATPLVSTPRRGRVETTTGASASLDLRPIPGPPTAGSQLSLAAFRLLGLSLTGLHEVTVYAE